MDYGSVFKCTQTTDIVNELSTGTIQESKLLILSSWYELSLQSLYIFECD